MVASHMRDREAHHVHQSGMNSITPADLGCRSTLLVDKHAAYIKGFSKIWEVRLLMTV
jgi:hypothetical protein